MLSLIRKPYPVPKALFVFFGLFVWTLQSLQAQGKLEDYQRSEALRNNLKDKVYNAPAVVNWSKSSQWAWYAIQTARGKEFISVNLKFKFEMQSIELIDYL